MITGTIFLIMSIFGGSPNFFSIPKTETRIFTIQKVEKQVRSNITDPSREKEVLELFNQAKKEIKSLDKQLKTAGKEFKKLQSDKTVKSDELTVVFLQSEEVRRSVQSVLVEKRLKLRQLINEKEWTAIMEEGINNMADNPKKRDKEIRQIEKYDKKILNKVQKTLNKQIEDEGRRTRALNAYMSFEKKVNVLTEESIDYLKQNDLAAQKHQATQSVLEEVFTTLNKSREEAMTSFLEMRDELIELCSDHEWKKISKMLNSML